MSPVSDILARLHIGNIYIVVTGSGFCSHSYPNVGKQTNMVVINALETEELQQVADTYIGRAKVEGIIDGPADEVSCLVLFFDLRTVGQYRKLLPYTEKLSIFFGLIETISVLPCSLNLLDWPVPKEWCATE
jgi:hypothetical protein